MGSTVDAPIQAGCPTEQAPGVCAFNGDFVGETELGVVLVGAFVVALAGD